LIEIILPKALVARLYYQIIIIIICVWLLLLSK